MAIAKLKKLSFCGLAHDKQRVLEALQELGCIHLIAAAGCGFATDEFKSTQVQDALKALKYLRQCPRMRHQVRNGQGFDMARAVAETLEVEDKTRIYSDQRDFLNKRIADLAPWGDFRLPEEQQLLGLKLWFYIVPARAMRQVRNSKLTWYVAYQDNLHSYVVVVAPDEPPAAAMPIARTHTGAVPLSALQAELQQVELTLEDLQAQRESLTRWIWMLNYNLAAAENHTQLQYAEHCIRDTGGAFVIQGWGTEQDLPKLDRFAEQHGLALLTEDPAEGEKPPTLLTGNKQWSGGEDMVLFYQTPDYYGWDPSKIVFFSFAVFFAMILSDAGYAALFGLLLALKWRAMGRSATGTRLRVLAVATVGISLLWGMLTGVYFGTVAPFDSLLGKVRILNIEDFSAMMYVAVGAGVVHITLANLVKAWQLRGRRSLYAALGWAGLAPCGMLIWYAQTGGNHAALRAGYWGLGLCVAIIVLFSSERQVKTPFDHMRRILDSLEKLIELPKIFGDVMSYMRLFALGLAGASLALTFNQLAHEAYHAHIHEHSGLGVLFALLILLLGHGLNIALCILSGVVHGLRLNFIEFYNWSVAGEGYPFKAFSKKEFGNE